MDKLCENEKLNLLTIFSDLKLRLKIKFLKEITISKEKWITYSNSNRGKLLHSKTCIQKIYFVYFVAHYELIKYGETINSGIYCIQIERCTRDKRYSSNFDKQKMTNYFARNSKKFTDRVYIYYIPRLYSIHHIHQTCPQPIIIYFSYYQMV